MTTTMQMQRAADKIARLALEGRDLVMFWRASSEVLADVVPHYLSPCWYTFDPASLLVTSHFQTELPELEPEWLAHEYLGDDIHKMADVVRSKRGMSTLHEVTGDNPSLSPGWRRFVQPYGGDQQLLLALRSRTGDAWGMMGLYREPGEPRFEPNELRFLAEVTPFLAEGARRGLLVGEAADPDGPEGPGLVILREDWRVESLTPGADRWLDELPDGAWASRGVLPPSVLSVAGQALRTAHGFEVPGEIAFARVLTRAGRWMVLHGAALVADGARRVAIIIEPAHPARIASLLMAAYGLTDREQDVTRLVLQGNSTAEIAGRLFVSPQTVQQHLKSIFSKIGVHSRRELVSKIFFGYYEPRVRDNERRALVGQPLRGGPVSA